MNDFAGHRAVAAWAASQPPPVKALPSGERFSFDLPHILSALAIIGLEIAVVTIVCGVLYAAAAVVLNRAARNPRLAAWSTTARVKTRRLLLATAALLIITLLAYNAWVIARGLDVRAHTVALVTSITRETQIAVLMALVKLALSAIGLVLAARLLRRLLGGAADAIKRWDRIKGDGQALDIFFKGLDRVIVNAAWLMLAVVATRWLLLSQRTGDILLVVLAIYLIVAIGIMVIRLSRVIVDTIAGNEPAPRPAAWLDEVLRSPESLVADISHVSGVHGVIAVGSLALYQVEPFRHLASWGPILIEAFAIFFAARVLMGR